jgi:hypothetical protein
MVDAALNAGSKFVSPPPAKSEALHEVLLRINKLILNKLTAGGSTQKSEILSTPHKAASGIAASGIADISFASNTYSATPTPHTGTSYKADSGPSKESIRLGLELMKEVSICYHL